MRRTDNGTGPVAGPDYRVPERGPLPDLPLYERLIDNGIADADSRGTIIDPSPPGGWLSGWPPGHRNKTSPGA
jgi:hypothetical protein